MKIKSGRKDLIYVIFQNVTQGMNHFGHISKGFDNSTRDIKMLYNLITVNIFLYSSPIKR